jgi:proteasome assembly chaperone (PAC2) family protein
MGWNDHQDPELADLIEQLTAAGYLTDATPASTVAQKVAASGKASLSAAELQTFDQEIVPALRALAQKQEEDEQRAQSEDE